MIHNLILCNMFHIFDNERVWISRQYITIHCKCRIFLHQKTTEYFCLWHSYFIKLLNKISPFVYLTYIGEDSSDILNYYFQTRLCKSYNQMLVWLQLKSWHFDKNLILSCYKIAFVFAKLANSILYSSIHFWLFFKKKDSIR